MNVSQSSVVFVHSDNSAVAIAVFVLEWRTADGDWDEEDEQDDAERDDDDPENDVARNPGCTCSHVRATKTQTVH